MARAPKHTPELEKFIKDKLEEGDHYSGVSCSFVYIGEEPYKWGVKCYALKRHRNVAMRRQEKAWKVGAGPACFSPFSFFAEYTDEDGIWRAEMLYCFFTEAADEIGEHCIPATPWDRTDEEKALVRALRSVNLRDVITDLHEENVGRINGKLVCVDFYF